MLHYLIQHLKAIFNRRSFRKAVKEAKALRASTFKKHLVIYWQGEFRAVSKQRLKQLHAEGSFKRGVNLRQLERMAVFTTK